MEERFLYAKPKQYLNIDQVRERCQCGRTKGYMIMHLAPTYLGKNRIRIDADVLEDLIQSGKLAELLNW